MTDNSDMDSGAGKRRRRQRPQKKPSAKTAADPLAGLSDQTERVRAQLEGLQTNLADVQRSSTSERAAELREANEQLLLAALHAKATAENAVSHLDELAHSSKHDTLTGTPNRALMLDRLENAIAFAKRHGTRLGVLFIDLDGFKQINDTLGHAVGDAVVQLVARRLESQVRQSDTVSRYGGDEFLVLLAELTQPSDAARVAEKILVALATPSRVDNHLLSLPASIGIALFPDDGIDARTLISSADTAMYSCKKHGGHNFRFYGDAIAQPRSVPSPPRQSGNESSIGERAAPERILREANERLVLSALTAKKLEERARRKYARQVDVMALAAHELRNALMPVKTAAGLLDPDLSPDLMLSVRDILERQVAHMSRLVEDLLVSGCTGPGSFRVAMSCVDIVDVLTRAIEASRPALGAKHQQLTTHLPPGPLIIQADAMRLAQIFCNLLDNASKYTPVGGRISLTGELGDDAVVITVSDNGMGIPPARLGSIFQLFARDESRSAIGGGLGIGLSVVRTLVEAHRGHVVARSRGENLGSEFAVTLPTRLFPDPPGKQVI
jgi:diguanylate cyclase